MLHIFKWSTLRTLCWFTLCCTGVVVVCIYGVELLRALTCPLLKKACDTPLWWIGAMMVIVGGGLVAFIKSWLVLERIEDEQQSQKP